MVFDQIEQLKQTYTDKYVVVDERRPELARFKGFTGLVKTVNMNGRALVEFDAYANVGWFDIGLDYLKVVDAPPPKPAERHEKPAKAEVAAKPKAPAAAGEKKLSPLEAARAQGAAKKPSEPAKKSTSDVLAAARAGAAGATAKPPAAGEKKQTTAEILAAARTAKTGAPVAKAAEPTAPAKPAASPPAAAPKGKLSTADILASARKNAPPAAAAPAAAPPKPKVTAPPPTAEAPPFEPPTAEEPPQSPAAKPAKAAPAGGLPTDVAGIIAWCRQHDAK